MSMARCRERLAWRTCGCDVKSEHQLQQQTREAVLRPGRGVLALRCVQRQDLQNLPRALVQGGAQGSRHCSRAGCDQQGGPAAADAAAICIGVTASLCLRC